MADGGSGGVAVFVVLVRAASRMNCGGGGSEVSGVT